MSATDLTLLIAAAGLLLSVLSSIWISGAAWGKIRRDVDQLQADRASLATKDDVARVAGDLKEIKGMFRVTLDPQYGGRE